MLFTDNRLNGVKLTVPILMLPPATSLMALVTLSATHVCTRLELSAAKAIAMSMTSANNNLPNILKKRFTSCRIDA